MGQKEKNEEFIKNLSAVSHEMQTPVNIIAATAKLIEQKSNLDKLDKELVDKYVECIERNCRKVTMLISNISEINRANISKTEFISCKHFFDTFCDTVKPYCKNTGTKIKCEFKADNEFIHIPVFTVERILLNLITNGIKYNISEQKKITLTMAVEDENVIFRVKDNGIGIAKEHISKVTEEFFRVDKDVSTGLGLGLSLVKKYLDDMKGTMEIKSQINKGTEVCISIPSIVDTEFDTKEIPYIHIPEISNYDIEFSQFQQL